MQDYLVKALAYDGQVRAYATATTETVGEAQRRHHTWPTATAALGRTITAALLLGSGLKNVGTLTTKIDGHGPLGVILADCNARGEVRGYVTNPQTHFALNEKGKLDVQRAVGKDGLLSVVKDTGQGEYFTSQVPLVSGELGEDFTYYLVTSEQVPSAVGVGVTVNPDNTVLAVGGFLVQMMPGCKEETVLALEKRLSAVAGVSTLIEHGLTPEGILEMILGAEQVQFLETMPVRFQCRCSEERVVQALVSLGKEEINDMIEKDGEAEVICHFCNERYHLSCEQLEELEKEAR